MPRPAKQLALLTAICLVANAIYVASPANAATVWGQDWQTNGSATAISPTHIVLTPNTQGQAGSAWVTTPLAVTDSSAFSASFEFRISGTNDDSEPGDGMAFVIHGLGADELGTAGGDLGYGGMPGNLLAVEFDTWDCCGEAGAPHVAIHLDGDDVPGGGESALVASPYGLVRDGIAKNPTCSRGSTLIRTPPRSASSSATAT